MDSAGAPREIELKLLIAPGALRRLAAHPLLKGGSRAVTRRLYSVYFDTPDLELRRQQVALRLRRDGRRWVQTIKGGGEARAGLHSRTEIECTVAGPFPDCAAIDDAVMADILAPPQLRAQLKPVFVTEFSRTLRTVTPDPGCTIEICIDRGDIRSGDRSQPICELELELKSGAVWQLFDFALQLLDTVPLRVENRSKAERGYALFEDAHGAT